MKLTDIVEASMGNYTASAEELEQEIKGYEAARAEYQRAKKQPLVAKMDGRIADAKAKLAKLAK